MKMTSYAPGTPNWVDLGSPNIAESIAFYGELFGWQAVDQGPDAGGYHMFELDGAAVAGLGPQMQPGIPPYWTTYIAVADTDATVERVKSAGGMVFVEPMDVFESGRMAVCADSSGAPFSVWQAKDHIGCELAGEPNTFCWAELTVRDADAAGAFYSKVFGWQPQTAHAAPGSAHAYTEWHLGKTVIGGMMTMDDNWPAEVPPHWMAYFAVGDADAATQQVLDLGGNICVPPTDIAPGRFSVVNDPHGAMFSLIALSPDMASQ